MAQDTIKTIKSRIKSSGLNWIPGATSISRLAKGAQDARLGLQVREEEMERVAQLISSAPATGQPLRYAKHVDWRLRNGENWVTDIRDQGNCGSCVSFAVVASLEAQARIQEDDNIWPLDLSEGELFFTSGQHCSDGWYPTDALDYIAANGVCDEQCFPYVDKDTNNSACSDRATRYLKSRNWKELLQHEERKKWLDEHGPLVAAMAVYRDFFYYKDGVYSPTTEELAGYHAISCIGYSEEEKCWICKNSWGTGWGDEGFFKIAYGASDIDTRFPMWGIANIEGPIVERHSGNGEVVTDFAEYTVIESTLDSDEKVLWAYLDGQWRHRILSIREAEVMADVIELSESVQVCYREKEILEIFGWRSYAKTQAMEHISKVA